MKFKKNVIPEIISDEIFDKLNKLNFFDYKRVRDYVLKKKFKELKKEHGSAGAIEILAKEFKELQPDTIKKIVYEK